MEHHAVWCVFNTHDFYSFFFFWKAGERETRTTNSTQRCPVWPRPWAARFRSPWPPKQIGHQFGAGEREAGDDKGVLALPSTLVPRALGFGGSVPPVAPGLFSQHASAVAKGTVTPVRQKVMEHEGDSDSRRPGPGGLGNKTGWGASCRKVGRGSSHSCKCPACQGGGPRAAGGTPSSRGGALGAHPCGLQFSLWKPRKPDEMDARLPCRL